MEILWKITPILQLGIPHPTEEIRLLRLVIAEGIQVLKQTLTELIPKQTTLIGEIHQIRLLLKKEIAPTLLQNQTQITKVIQLQNLTPVIEVIIQEVVSLTVEADPQEIQIEEVQNQENNKWKKDY